MPGERGYAPAAIPTALKNFSNAILRPHSTAAILRFGYVAALLSMPATATPAAPSMIRLRNPAHGIGDLCLGHRQRLIDHLAADRESHGAFLDGTGGGVRQGGVLHRIHDRPRLEGGKHARRIFRPYT